MYWIQDGDEQAEFKTELRLQGLRLSLMQWKLERENKSFFHDYCCHGD